MIIVDLFKIDDVVVEIVECIGDGVDVVFEVIGVLVVL